GRKGDDEPRAWDWAYGKPYAELWDLGGAAPVRRPLVDATDGHRDGCEYTFSPDGSWLALTAIARAGDPFKGEGVAQLWRLVPGEKPDGPVRTPPAGRRGAAPRASR